jgi:phage protein D
VTFSLSPQLRLIALIGLGAVVLTLGGMFFLVRGTLMAGDVEQLPPVVHHPKTTKATPAHRKHAQTKHATPTKHTAPTKHAAPTKHQTSAHGSTTTQSRTKTEPKTAATPKAQTPAVPTPTPRATIETPGVAPNGLPIVIAQALRKHAVVVVALVVPGAELDEMTIAEARAGAKAAGVGFLSVNVLKNSIGRPLAQKLGVIQTPSLVVYRRPATVFVRFEGFADRDTVRQAATSARAGR